MPYMTMLEKYKILALKWYPKIWSNFKLRLWLNPLKHCKLFFEPIKEVENSEHESDKTLANTNSTN